jgi:hypothetical protein
VHRFAGAVVLGGAGVVAGRGALARGTGALTGVGAPVGWAVDKVVEGGGKGRAAGALVGESCLPVDGESRCRREG